MEKRGTKDGKGPLWTVVTGSLALVCLLYCLCIWLFMGYGTKFFLIWGVLAAGFGVLAFLSAHPAAAERIPKWIRRGFWVCVILGLLLFGTVEGMIFSRFHAVAQDGADYVIVLGAQWKGRGPSYILQKRLDKAVEYLNANPDTCVIVSGGQGSNESVPEAWGMADYLKNAGIEEARILQEDASTNTNENLKFCSAFLDPEKDRVVLVTNNFHMFRALKIARKQGYAKIEGLAAGSYPAMMPNNLLREFVGVSKDFIMGNL